MNNVFLGQVFSLVPIYSRRSALSRKIVFAVVLLPIILSACGASQGLADKDEVEVEGTSAVATIEDPTEEPIDLGRVEIESADGTILVGTIHLPDGEGPFPSFVWVHGSGAVTRTQGGGSVVPALVEGGYAVLIMDKRGVGESGGDYFGVNPAGSEYILGQLSEDIRAAVRILSGFDFIDPNQIGLFGNSQAGWIIPQAAVGLDLVSRAVILVGPTVSVGQENYYSSLTGDNSANLTDEKLEDVYARYSTFSGEMGYDPRADIEALDIPVIWVLGGKDASIPTQESVNILDEIIAELGKDFTVHLYPLGTHGLQNAETGAQYNFMDEVVLPWIEALSTK
jgi:dipeptidyl aminopeptidase/acylaminoacyl peptidase